jgi:hypothetical protein
MGRRLRYTKWRNEQNLKRNSGWMQIKSQKPKQSLLTFFIRLATTNSLSLQEYDVKHQFAIHQLRYQ